MFEIEFPKESLRENQKNCNLWLNGWLEKTRQLPVDNMLLRQLSYPPGKCSSLHKFKGQKFKLQPAEHQTLHKSHKSATFIGVIDRLNFIMSPIIMQHWHGRKAEKRHDPMWRGGSISGHNKSRTKDNDIHLPKNVYKPALDVGENLFASRKPFKNYDAWYRGYLWSRFSVGDGSSIKSS